MIELDPKMTALVLIDLQKGIVSRQTAPHSANEVVERSKRLAASFRSAGAPVILVNVAFSKDFGDAPRAPVDSPMQVPPGGLPEDFAELVDGLATPTDLRVTKRQWGAFFGTDLDVQLRRRGIKTIVLGGIATNIGVESTARQAWELNYELIIGEDITATFSPEMQDFAVKVIFPRISRVAKVADIGFRSP